MFSVLRNLGNNELTSIDGMLFNGLVELQDLILAHNYIKIIPKDAFIGLSKLEYL